MGSKWALVHSCRTCLHAASVVDGHSGLNKGGGREVDTAKRRNLLLAVSLLRSEFSSTMDSSHFRPLLEEEIRMGRGGVEGRPGDPIV